jgi:hypothetical protein
MSIRVEKNSISVSCNNATAYEDFYIPQLLTKTKKPDGKDSKRKKQSAIAKIVYI